MLLGLVPLGEAYRPTNSDKQEYWKTEYLMQNRDYSVAMKIPHFMTNLGLKNVDVRMNDHVTYLAPNQPSYSQTLQDIMKADHCEPEQSVEQIEL